MVTQPQQLVPTLYYDAHFLPHEAIHLVPTPSRASGIADRGGIGRLAKDKAQSGMKRCTLHADGTFNLPHQTFTHTHNIYIYQQQAAGPMRSIYSFYKAFGSMGKSGRRSAR